MPAARGNFKGLLNPLCEPFYEMVKVRVIHTDEELTIARSVNRILHLGNRSPEKRGGVDPYSYELEVEQIPREWCFLIEHERA
jgi:hypothetical protein